MVERIFERNPLTPLELEVLSALIDDDRFIIRENGDITLVENVDGVCVN